MSESEIIRVEYEAIRKFCQGDKKLAYKVINELGSHMRDYIDVKHPNKVTVDELCTVIQSATCNWQS